jgi:hypothetical protein
LRFVLAPLWAGLAAALSLAVPVAAAFLLPMGAARLGRSALESRRPFEGFLLGALTVPAAALLGLLLAPTGAMLAPLVVIAAIALPAMALYAGARDGRRRDRLYLLVASASGIGGLAILLGFAVGTGVDPGEALAARWNAFVPEMIAFYKTTGQSEATIAAAGRFTDLVGLALSKALPGLVLAMAFLHAALVVYPLGIFAGLPACALRETSFARFTTPLAAAALFVPAGLLAALGEGQARIVAVDVLLPLAVLFFLRGLAIIRALLDRGRAGIVGRALVYATIFFMPFPLLLALGGLFDEFLDIRGRLERAAAARKEKNGL